MVASAESIFWVPKEVYGREELPRKIPRKPRKVPRSVAWGIYISQSTVFAVAPTTRMSEFASVLDRTALRLRQRKMNMEVFQPRSINRIPV